jgi:NAD(P)-dependent dehydrogenase (short-subunit alcohol dehydrogenase family)
VQDGIMTSELWTAADIPPQTGRTAVVTGANSGLGRVTALELARAGARVMIACRSAGKGEDAAAAIRSQVPDASIEVSEQDLADHASVRQFAQRLRARCERLDLLINNAGVMAPPRRTTNDGFESQFGTNHLGHFALTGLLLELLLAAPAPRVVTVSSGAHRIGTIHFDDLQGERRYNNWWWYGQSKLANLMFCFELQRRATAASADLLSMAAHPGYAATNLQFAGPAAWYERAIMAVSNRVIAQSAAMGALPELYAATASNVAGGEYIGPLGLGKMRGYPGVVRSSARSYDVATAQELWCVSEELTDVRYAAIQKN